MPLGPRLPTLWQLLTYLFGVCLFSISFLVFLNSSVSFVITDIIGQKNRVGDAVGTLGFADELVAIIACPVWGMLSDRLGVRIVSVSGYLLIGIALAVFVRARNVYPELLLARMFFALGGAACTTMVTAILPSIASDKDKEKSITPSRTHSRTASGVSDVTVTQANWSEHEVQPAETNSSLFWTSGPRLAGIVGVFTGCGALIALSVFLPLPSLFQKHGHRPDDALRETYYIVAFIAFIISILCSIGLRNLKGQDGKGWHNLWLNIKHTERLHQKSLLPYWQLFYQSVCAGSQPEIGLGYIGGFVARASSVGISLFIPLLVNHHFISNGLCKVDDSALVKIECREAYILAAKLTGVSQLVALLLAPAFGFFSDRKRVLHIPLLLAAISGVIGYAALAFSVENPDPKQEGGSNLIYLWVSLIGTSQIGAIVCSLGSISRGISESTKDKRRAAVAEEEEPEDTEPLLARTSPTKHLKSSSLSHIQGSIAGTYSLAGGVAILFLTKVGGALFDSMTVAAPFVIMLVFNALLFGAVVADGGFRWIRRRQRNAQQEAETVN